MLRNAPISFLNTKPSNERGDGGNNGDNEAADSAAGMCGDTDTSGDSTGNIAGDTVCDNGSEPYYQRTKTPTLLSRRQRRCSVPA